MTLRTMDASLKAIIGKCRDVSVQSLVFLYDDGEGGATLECSDTCLTMVTTKPRSLCQCHGSQAWRRVWAKQMPAGAEALHCIRIKQF